MPLWKLIPNTHPTDPRWQDRPIYDEVVVRAATSGAARRLAARFELGLTADTAATPAPHAVGNGSEPLGSALEDEKLYRMLALGTEDTATATGAPIGDAVLRAVRAKAAEDLRVGGASGPSGPSRKFIRQASTDHT